jgi:tRNA A-37 threonylcarbamoyl transferase component Bud32
MKPVHASVRRKYIAHLIMARKCKISITLHTLLKHRARKLQRNELCDQNIQRKRIRVWDVILCSLVQVYGRFGGA